MKVRSRAVSVIDGAPHIPGAIFKRPATKGPGARRAGRSVASEHLCWVWVADRQHLDRYEPSPIGWVLFVSPGSRGQ